MVVPGPEMNFSLSSKADKILWAAKEVFLDRGYEVASMDEIAAAATVSKRTIYNHFGSKEALFVEVMHFATRLIAAKLREPEFYSDDPIEAITSFVARFLQLVTWTDSVALQRLLVAEIRRFPDASREFFETTITMGSQMLQTYLEKYGRSGASDLLYLAAKQRHMETLFGVLAPIQGPPGDNLSAEIDLSPIRKVICGYWEDAAPDKVKRS